MMATNIKNLLELAGITVQVKNEFASGAVGDIGAFDAWVELWIEEKNEQQAKIIIEQAKHKSEQQDWFCRHCKESNSASFEICWQCGNEPE